MLGSRVPTLLRVDKRQPGRLPCVVGMLVAAVGTIVVLSGYRDGSDRREILVGGILVVAGLLLRIEGAIWASREHGGGPQL